MAYVGKQPQPKFLGQVDDLTVAGDANIDTNTLVVDSVNNRVGVGEASPATELHLSSSQVDIRLEDNSGTSNYADLTYTDGRLILASDKGNSVGSSTIEFKIDNTERMRIDSSGSLLVAQTANSSSVAGHIFNSAGVGFHVRDGGVSLVLNRLTSDGNIASIRQAGVEEGSISVSGSTVSYNGGHLARWSRLADDNKDTSIVKGTVMTNLDEMVEWSHDAVEAVDAVFDEDGNVVTEAVEAKEAYTEDNEQLNKMAVSSVEGDPNVAGVFVNWDEEDDFNDMNVAMTGDMVIRIAQGTTVARGDLLMSAGDGTAKPQGDDIVRSKTIAKVTSTHVSHTYDDGSYLVPCVLMAC